MFALKVYNRFVFEKNLERYVCSISYQTFQNRTGTRRSQMRLDSKDLLLHALLPVPSFYKMLPQLAA